MRLGIIAGTGFERLAKPRFTHRVETPWGDVLLHAARLRGLEVLFASRHGEERVAAHRVNFRALVQAFADARPDWLVGLNNVGGLKPGYAAGTWVVASDFVDFADPARGTFVEDEPVHTDMSEPFCPTLRGALRAGAGSVAGVARAKEGVYVTTPGPRLETPAEVRVLARVADVVGMTGAPEAALARERGLCYAQLCLVSNAGAGLGGQLSAKDIAREASRRLPEAGRILASAAASLPAKKSCDCAKVPARARL